MVELVDALDSKSSIRKDVRVRFSPEPPFVSVLTTVKCDDPMIPKIARRTSNNTQAPNFAGSNRMALFDTLRGAAMILMALYHFCFDLNSYGVLQQDFNHDDFWLNFRAVIMTLFTGLVGVSFSLGHISYQSKSYRRRLVKLLICCTLISIATWIMYPQSWVYWGILHFIFVISLLGPVLIRLKWVGFPLGVGAVALPLFFRHIFFMRPLWIISGLSPLKPNTEDFSPIFPWLGVVLIGIAVGWFFSRKQASLLSFEIQQLSWLGKNSLLFYMTHQLVLFPLAWIVAQITQ